jgi:hypothetical protein
MFTLDDGVIGSVGPLDYFVQETEGEMMTDNYRWPLIALRIFLPGILLPWTVGTAEANDWNMAAESNTEWLAHGRRTRR